MSIYKILIFSVISGAGSSEHYESETRAQQRYITSFACRFAFASISCLSWASSPFSAARMSAVSPCTEQRKLVLAYDAAPHTLLHRSQLCSRPQHHRPAPPQPCYPASRSHPLTLTFCKAHRAGGPSQVRSSETTDRTTRMNKEQGCSEQARTEYKDTRK